MIEIQPGDVVRIGGTDMLWKGTLMIVEKVRDWGVIGSVHGSNQAEYPLRVARSDVTAVYREVRVIQ